jgi:hypothetical protein
VNEPEPETSILEKNNHKEHKEHKEKQDKQDSQDNKIRIIGYL